MILSHIGEIAGIFSVLVTCLTPLILAWFGWRTKQREIKDEEFQKLQIEFTESEKKRHVREQEEQRKFVKDTKSSLKSLQDDINQLKTKNEELEAKLDREVELSAINFEYSQCLGKMVSAIADSMISIDSLPATEELRKAISEHRIESSEILHKIYRIQY